MPTSLLLRLSVLSLPIPSARPSPHRTRTSFAPTPDFSPRRLPVCHPPLASTSSTATNFAGWDEPGLFAAPKDCALVGQAQAVLAAFGFRDGRHGLLFLSGFLAALLVSRLRVSPVALLPVSFMVFAAGFVLGTARVSGSNESDGKLRELGGVIRDLDSRIGVLSDRLDRIDDIECSEIIDFLKLKLGNAAKILDAADDLEKKEAQKVDGESVESVKVVASHIVDYFKRLVKDNLEDSRSPRKKAYSGKDEVVEKSGSLEVDTSVSSKNVSKKNLIDEETAVPVSMAASKISKVEGRLERMNVAGEENFSEHQTFSNGKAETWGYKEDKFDDSILFYDEQISNTNGSLRSTSEQRRSGRAFSRDKHGWVCDEVSDPRMVGKSSERRFVHESDELSLLERTFEISRKSYKLRVGEAAGRSSSEVQAAEDENVKNSEVMKEKIVQPYEDEFDENFKTASELLRTAKEHVKAKNDEVSADELLYKSAKLLSTAVSLRPRSILALGQLGNTYLLHGELKLRISRELRVILSHNDAYLTGNELTSKFWNLGERNNLSRENAVSILMDVCEECENLLIKAGRNYRSVLSLDGSDIKALYNWGLALSYRAQLISDVGPGSAVDADKVYLAAIDKFDAMLSRSNNYAPEALYRWGVALQQRSQLRPRKSKEKIRLLQQAKSMFEEVLYIEADNPAVREALSSCLMEINYHDRW